MTDASLMLVPVVDMKLTGQKIADLRLKRGITVHELQTMPGFSNPQSIYKWQRGEILSIIENLVAPACILSVPMEEIPTHRFARASYGAEALAADPALELTYIIAPPRMASLARAAQFAPFAALTGYEALIAESARLVVPKLEPGEEQREGLNARLNLLALHLSEEPQIRIVYFKKDPTKDGGSYETIEGVVQKIDPVTNTIRMRNGTVIAMEDLWAIDGACFGNTDADC